MKSKIIITTIATAIVAGGLGFWGGTKYKQSRNRNMFRNFGQGTGFSRNMGLGGQTAGNRTNGGFKPVAGEIIAKDDKSITVKLTDGSSKIVVFSDSTQVNKTETATKEILTVGTKVSVFGQTNTDGSVTAQSIQLNPEFRGQAN